MIVQNYPSLEAPHNVDVVSLLREALGQHYDVALEEEAVAIGKRVVNDPVVRIYAKGEKEARLSFWLS